MSSLGSTSPPSFPRPFPVPAHPAAPLAHSASLSTSPSATLYGRLSNGSTSAPSPTHSRESFHGVSFLLQIGLTRETVNLDPSDVSLSAVKELVCSIVDQKVNTQVCWC
ncbi:serine/threonine-protein kinase D3 isoform X1 [Tachysurus ichikawai]